MSRVPEWAGAKFISRARIPSAACSGHLKEKTSGYVPPRKEAIVNTVKINHASPLANQIARTCLTP
eukprot:5898078-Amphidinium_carterae.2